MSPVLFDAEAPTPILETNLRRLLLRCEQRCRKLSRGQAKAIGSRAGTPVGRGHDGSDEERIDGHLASAFQDMPDLEVANYNHAGMLSQCGAMEAMMAELKSRRLMAAQHQQAAGAGEDSLRSETMPSELTDDAELQGLARRINRVVGLIRSRIDAELEPKRSQASTAPSLPKSCEEDLNKSTTHDSKLKSANIRGAGEKSEANIATTRIRRRTVVRDKQDHVSFKRELISWKAELGLIGGNSEAVAGGERSDAEGQTTQLEHVRDTLEENLLDTTSSLKALANSSREAIQKDIDRIQRTKDLADENLEKVDKLTERTKKNTKAAWGGFMTEIMLFLTAAAMTAGVVLLMRIPGFGKNF